jgi:dihydroorotate dehydrogenase
MSGVDRVPDWSYQTLFRPLLFRLPSKLARDFTLKAMGSLSRVPGGSFVIRTMGHMESSPLLESKLAGIPLRYPVGLSGGLDPDGTAHRALAQFGFGFIEIGPVTIEGHTSSSLLIQRDLLNEAIIYPDADINEGLHAIAARLRANQGHELPLMLRIKSTPGCTPVQARQELLAMIEELSYYAAGFYIDSLDASWPAADTVEHLLALQQSVRLLATVKPMLLYIPLDYPLEALGQLLESLKLEGAWSGAIIGDTVRTAEGDWTGRSAKSLSLDKVRCLRECNPSASFSIIATGGIHEPLDALELMDEGTDYVQLNSGLVYSGPGLPKRINEAVIYEKIRGVEEPPPASFWLNWGWMCLLGIGMGIGGLLAWIIAATSVVLPYDILFLGMEPGVLNKANPLVLQFMSHDRVTLAGTMISIGVLYYQLARHGLRKGLHWTKTALLTSAVVGFGSFFLYLGHGYFDPLHALVAILLFPMFILSMRRIKELPSWERPNMVNDRAWRLAQWGQLMMVTLGISLALGGIVISVVGITDVFVPQDLTYLCATPAMLNEINGRLMPLIAHDRAGFGGALFSNAIAMLTIALWGINQGQRWLWWTFLLGGLPGFIAGLTVHLTIGYTDFVHLLPAYFALMLYVFGLVFLYPYLMNGQKDPR